MAKLGGIGLPILCRHHTSADVSFQVASRRLVVLLEDEEVDPTRKKPTCRVDDHFRVAEPGKRSEKAGESRGSRGSRGSKEVCIDYDGRMHVVSSTKRMENKRRAYARIRPPSNLYFLYFLM